MGGQRLVVLNEGWDKLEYLVEGVLRPAGYEVLTAANIEECLHLGLWEKPDLIITTSPSLSPSTLATHRSIQAKLPDMPVLLVASTGTQELMEEALGQGARGCLLYPFAPEALREAIRKALQGRRSTKETKEPSRTGKPPKKGLYLQALGKALVSTLDLEQVLTRAVEAATYLTEAEEGSLTLLDPESDALYLRAAQGRGERYAHPLQKKVEDGLIEEVLRSGEARVAHGPRGYEWGEGKISPLVAFSLHVPLKWQGQVRGVLSIFRSEPKGEFSPGERDLLLALADYVAIAISNTQRFADLLQAGQEFKELKEGEPPLALSQGVERRKDERRKEERRQGDRRGGERRQGERRSGERRKGERRERERRQEERDVDLLPFERRKEERRKAERRREERREGERRQAERRKGERRADLPWTGSQRSAEKAIWEEEGHSHLQERRSEVAEKLVGRVSHYYGRIGVAVIEVLNTIKVGDTIRIKGGIRDVEQLVDSMEIEHQKVEVAKKGQSIGLQVIEKVREGDQVYKI